MNGVVIRFVLCANLSDKLSAIYLPGTQERILLLTDKQLYRINYDFAYKTVSSTKAIALVSREWVYGLPKLTMRFIAFIYFMISKMTWTGTGIGWELGRKISCASSMAHSGQRPRHLQHGCASPPNYCLFQIFSVVDRCKWTLQVACHYRSNS